MAVTASFFRLLTFIPTCVAELTGKLTSPNTNMLFQLVVMRRRLRPVGRAVSGVSPRLPACVPMPVNAAVAFQQQRHAAALYNTIKRLSSNNGNRAARSHMVREAGKQAIKPENVQLNSMVTRGVSQILSVVVARLSNITKRMRERSQDCRPTSSGD